MWGMGGRRRWSGECEGEGVGGERGEGGVMCNDWCSFLFILSSSSFCDLLCCLLFFFFFFADIYYSSLSFKLFTLIIFAYLPIFYHH